MASAGKAWKISRVLHLNPEQLRACEQLIRVLDVNKAAMQVFDFS